MEKTKEGEGRGRGKGGKKKEKEECLLVNETKKKQNKKQ